MFCSKCGKELPDGSRFCSQCGSPPDDSQAAGQPTSAYDSGMPAAEYPGAMQMPQASQAPQGNRKIIIAAIATAAVLVVAVVIGVFACSSSGSNSAQYGSPAVPTTSSSSGAVGGSDDPSAFADEENEGDDGYGGYNESEGDDGYDSYDGPTNINDLTDSWQDSRFTGTWTDPEYGDTLTFNSNGTCTINQVGVASTVWSWTPTDSGIVISNSSGSYELVLGSSGSKNVLYNDAKRLYFVQ